MIHHSKYTKSAQDVVIHYIFSSESLGIVNSKQIVNSLRVLFLVCRVPLGVSVREIVPEICPTVRQTLCYTIEFFLIHQALEGTFE